MSHFTVAVFSDGTKTVDELLAPYQENNMGDCPREYMEFISITEEEKKNYENETIKMICLPDGEMIAPWNEKKLKKTFSNTTFNDGKDRFPFYENKKEYSIKNTRDSLLGNVQIVFDLGEKGAEKRNVPFKEVYPTFDEYMKKYVAANYDEEQQDYGYWENPNAKWDYWQIGGRWKNFLKASKGNEGEKSLIFPIEDEKGKYSQARVKDINFEPDKEKYNKALRWWEVVVENSPLKNGEVKKDFLNFYNKEYLIRRYKNKETYAAIESSVITYAVILPDGTWHQKGQMGWFGCGNESDDASLEWDLKYKENFIDKAEPDWILTIVDCHI